MPDFTAWVLRAGMTGFSAGCRALQPDVPRFGDLVQVRTQEQVTIYGLIDNVIVYDDPVVRQLILADVLEPELGWDQRPTRLAPIELRVVTLGYRRPDGPIIYGLPPQPPLTLDVLSVCDAVELRAFTASLLYLPLLLSSADDLLATHLGRAAGVQPVDSRSQFLGGAGRELARLLGATDLIRLAGILKQLSRWGAALNR
jgi:hypothetical protein